MPRPVALARALGGKAEPNERPEIGYVTVESGVPELISPGPWFQRHAWPVSRCLTVPICAWLILGSVLNREVGDASVMREQIDRLLSVGAGSSVMLHVVPDMPEVAGALGGAFAIATDGASDVAAYTDSNIQGTVHTDPDLVTRAARVFGRATLDADAGSSYESRRKMDALTGK
jgi:hypothetical protein